MRCGHGVGGASYEMACVECRSCVPGRAWHAVRAGGRRSGLGSVWSWRAVLWSDWGKSTAVVRDVTHGVGDGFARLLQLPRAVDLEDLRTFRPCF